jgi:hypothetical protein
VIEKFDIYIGIAVNGIFTGLGVALGNWVAQKHIIEKMENRNGKAK